MMSRRNSNHEKSMAIGGVESINDWDFVPIAVPDDGASLEEPYWYERDDGTVSRAVSRQLRLEAALQGIQC